MGRLIFDFMVEESQLISYFTIAVLDPKDKTIAEWMHTRISENYGSWDRPVLGLETRQIDIIRKMVQEELSLSVDSPFSNTIRTIIRKECQESLQHQQVVQHVFAHEQRQRFLSVQENMEQQNLLRRQREELKEAERLSKLAQTQQFFQYGALQQQQMQHPHTPVLGWNQLQPNMHPFPAVALSLQSTSRPPARKSVSSKFNKRNRPYARKKNGNVGNVWNAALPSYVISGASSRLVPPTPAVAPFLNPTWPQQAPKWIPSSRPTFVPMPTSNSHEKAIAEWKYVPLHPNPVMAATLACMNFKAANERTSFTFGGVVWEYGLAHLTDCMRDSVMDWSGNNSGSAMDMIYTNSSSLNHPQLSAQEASTIIAHWKYVPLHQDNAAAATTAHLNFDAANKIAGFTFADAMRKLGHEHLRECVPRQNDALYRKMWAFSTPSAAPTIPSIPSSRIPDVTQAFPAAFTRWPHLPRAPPALVTIATQSTLPTITSHAHIVSSSSAASASPRRQRNYSFTSPPSDSNSYSCASVINTNGPRACKTARPAKRLFKSGADNSAAEVQLVVAQPTMSALHNQSPLKDIKQSPQPQEHSKPCMSLSPTENGLVASSSQRVGIVSSSPAAVSAASTTSIIMSPKLPVGETTCLPSAQHQPHRSDASGDSNSESQASLEHQRPSGEYQVEVVEMTFEFRAA
ncbi:hypothetical protein BGZ58_007946 [Dissophora ornata]|nr:hypothetical protein BGZ58_007946 [Dissophora ornata]